MTNDEKELAASWTHYTETGELTEPWDNVVDLATKYIAALRTRLPKKVTRFQPPTLNEWITRAKEIGYPVLDAEQAYHSYDAKGWMVGKSRMKKWQSAIQTCFTRYKSDHPNWRPDTPRNTKPIDGHLLQTIAREFNNPTWPPKKVVSVPFHQLPITIQQEYHARS